ncbi:MAG: SPOR domain-containing protein [Alphaproteobacteria bacterium]
MTERFSHGGGPIYAGRRSSRPRWAGRTVSVAIIAGVAVSFGVVGAVMLFGGDEGVDTGSGPTPIIHAEAGDTKRRPKEPGGLEIPHQDKLVFERLAQEPGEGRVERLLPLPEAPVELPVATATPDDDAPAPSEEVEVVALDTAAGATVDTIVDTAVATEAPAAESAVAAEVRVPEVPDPPAPVAEVEIEPEPEQPVPVAKSLPPARVQVAATAPRREPSSVRPAVGSGSGWRIQVASIRDGSRAEGAWNELRTRHDDLLAGLTLNVQRADLDQGTFYRLQAGPLVDQAAARKLCSALKARDQGCLVVQP